MTDIAAYKLNIQAFTDRLKGAIIEQISYDIDYHPTFNREKVPFEFIYSHAATLKTDKGFFQIQTNQTETGLDSFCVIFNESVEFVNGVVREINSRVSEANVSFLNEYSYRISITLEDKSLIFYAADIYDSLNELDFKVNDEMILIFEKLEEANKFDKLITTANKSL